MSSAWECLSALTDKSGRLLLPVLEDMRCRGNAVLLCSFGGDDPHAPLSAHLAESHAAQIASGIALLAEAGGSAEVLLYAADIDLSGITALLPEKLKVAVIAGPSSPVLREPTALYSVIDSGVIRSGNAEQDYKRTFLSYGYQGRPTLTIDAETACQALRLSEGFGMTKHIAVIGIETMIREAAIGTSLGTLTEDAAGMKHILLGGALGCYTTAAELENIQLSYIYAHDSLRFLGDGDCIVTHTEQLYQSNRELSCSKCVMCREGSWQLHAIFRDMTEGRSNRDDLALIEDICPIISAGSLCAFGRQMVNPALSAVTAFRDEFTEHVVGKNCAAGQCRGLLSYLIDPALCTGCGECLDACPEEAIEGEDGHIHMIDGKLCVKCGKCVPACPEKAIRFGEKIKVPKKLTKVGKFR